jgi:predicted nucleic acid-binding protein
MSALDFLDTNILVYSYATTDLRKQEVARGLVRKALAGHIATSTQVLTEFAATLLHKVQPRAEVESLVFTLDSFAPIQTIATDAEMVRRAVEVRARYGLHFYDSLIVAAAERAGCERIWSEDMNSGQKYFGITVQNPF